MNNGWKIAVVISLIVLIILTIIFWKNIFAKVIKPITIVLLKPSQEAYISRLHPQVQNKFRDFISRVESQTGYTIILTDGYRTFAEQQKQHEKDSKNPKPGYSMHNYGLAIDINATDGTNYLSKSDSKADWEQSGIPKIARDIGLSWGGDFKSYHDPVHIGLEGNYNIATLRQYAINQFGNNWNDIEGNQIQLA